MKLIISKLSQSSFRWFTGIIFLVGLITFSSCSTSREASLAYMDDIYKPYDANYLMARYIDKNEVSDQDASIIKPYRPTVADYSPYVKPINFSMSFGFGNYYPFYGGGYSNLCRPYGYYPAYYGYARRYFPYGGYNNSYFPYNSGYGDNGGLSGESYLYGNNVGYFHGINSSDRYKGSGVNYSNYVYYRASGSSGVVNTGRQSGSSGKRRYITNSNSGKSNTNKNYNSGSNSNSSGSFFNSGSRSSGSGGSVSPSRSSGSGGGSYTGKRPR